MTHLYNDDIPVSDLVDLLHLLPLKIQKNIFKYFFTFSYCRDTRLYKIFDGLHGKDSFKSLLRKYVKVVTIYISDSGYVSSNLDSNILSHYSNLFDRYPSLTTLVIKPHSVRVLSDIVAVHPSLVYFIATKVQHIEIFDLDVVELYGKRIFGPKIVKVAYRYRKDLLFLNELVAMNNLKVLNLVIDDPAVTSLKTFSKWLFNIQRYNPKVEKLILSISPDVKQRLTCGHDIFASFINIYSKYRQLSNDGQSSLMVELQYMYLTSMEDSLCDIINECKCHTLDLAFGVNPQNILTNLQQLNRLSNLVSLRVSSLVNHKIAQKVVLRNVNLRSLVIRHLGSAISCNFSNLSGLESLKLAHCTYREPLVFPDSIKALKLAHSVIGLGLKSIPLSLRKLSLSNISSTYPMIIDFNNASKLKEFTASSCASLIIQSLPPSLRVLAISSIKCLTIRNDHFLSDCQQIMSLLLNNLCDSAINQIINLNRWPCNLKVLSLQCVNALELCDLPTSLTKLELVTVPRFRKLYVYIGYSKEQVEKQSDELQDYQVESGHTDCAAMFLYSLPDCLCDISLRRMISGSKPNVDAIVKNSFEDRSFTIFEQANETIFLRSTKKIKINID